MFAVVRSRCLLPALALAALPTLAAAHGKPAGVLQVVAADRDGPRVVRLTEGLSIRLGDIWTYVCPNLFGLESAPLALSADGETTWVVGASDLMTLEANGDLTARGEPHLSADNTIGLTATSGAVYALRFAPSGSELYRLSRSGSQRIAQLPERYSTVVASDADLFVAGAEGDVLRVLQLSDAGEERAGWSYALPLAGAVPRLRSAHGELFVVLASPAGSELYRLSLDRDPDAGTTSAVEHLLSDSEPIYGPIADADGAVWVSADPALYQLNLDGIGPANGAVTRAITCVDQNHELAFACASTELYALDDDGIGARLMSLSALEAPGRDQPTLRGTGRCQAEWTLFRNDLVAIGVQPDDTRSRETVDGDIADTGGVAADVNEHAGGCSIGTPDVQPPRKVLIAVLVCLGLLCRRRDLVVAGARSNE